jgi:hypothetical protein
VTRKKSNSGLAILKVNTLVHPCLKKYNLFHLMDKS